MQIPYLDVTPLGTNTHNALYPANTYTHNILQLSSF